MVAATALLVGWSLVGMVLSPLLLARRAWPSRHPRLALAAWGLVFTSGVGSLVASLGVVLALAHDLNEPSTPSGTPSSAMAGSTPLDGSAVAGSLLVTGAGCLLTAVVGGVGALAVYRAVPLLRARREARSLLAGAREGTRLTTVHGVPVYEVDSEVPVARSLPGRRPVIVVTSALRAALGADELESVLEHERSHLAQHHGLLAQLAALQRSCAPGLPCSRALESSVMLLIELAADDRAARRSGRGVAAAALEKVGRLDGDVGLRLRARRLGGVATGEQATADTAVTQVV